MRRIITNNNSSKKTSLSFLPLLICLGLIGVLVISFYIRGNTELPLGNGNPKHSVEDYFVENMNVTPDEAKEMARNGVLFRIGHTSSLTGIIGNLWYYGFIDNVPQFRNRLELTEDITQGRNDAIKVGSNSIDRQSSYYLNYAMSDEQIADTLLNKGKYEYNFTRYSYVFMPDGGRTPTPYEEQWGEKTFTGLYTCLPQKARGSPDTLECALGIKTDEGIYYSLDTQNITQYVIRSLSINQRIIVYGDVIPIEAISSNLGKIYNIRGVMRVKEINPTVSPHP